MSPRYRPILWWVYLVCAVAGVAQAEITVSKQRFQISGVAVDSRNGAPVPFCHLAGVEIPGDEIVRPGTAAEPNQLAPSEPNPRTPSTPALQAQRQKGAGGRRIAGGDEETTADAQGRFLLEVPKAGAWRMTASARGYRMQAYEEHEEFSSAVVLTEAAPTMALRFQLVPDAVIGGVVRDEAGEPVEMARVTAELLLATEPDRVQPKVRPVAFAQTDDEGRYELSGLAAGAYRIRVQARPWYAMGVVRGQGSSGSAAAGASLDPSLDVIYPITWFPGTEDEAAASLLTLRGGESQLADVHLTAMPALHLQMARPLGSSPDDSTPRAQKMMTIARVSAEGWSDVSGAFTANGSDWDFGGLAPGTYEIKETEQDAAPNAEIRQIELRAGSLGIVGTQGSIPLTRVTVAIEGVPEEEIEQVVFVDVETGRRLSADPLPPPKSKEALPGRGAGTRIAMLPPRRYQVYAFGRGKTYLSSLTTPEGGVNLTGRVIEIRRSPVNLTLHLAKGTGEVVGFVQLADRADAGATVLLVPATLGEPGNLSFVERDQTNTDGSFVLHGVIPGKYILIAIDHGWQVNWRDAATLARYLPHGLAVELGAAGRAFEEIQAQAP